VTFADAVARLEQGLRRELPGPRAQDWLAPIPRRQWPTGFNPARIRHAAGLLLVFPGGVNAELAESAEKTGYTKEETTSRPHRANDRPENSDSLWSPRPLRSISGRPYVVLTVRSDNVRHGGQVSLPGGVVEPGETFEQAALREAHEEVALPLGRVRVIGALTPLDIPVSGFRLHPIVAVTSTPPALTPADAEVAHILEVGVDELLDPATLADTMRERDGIRYQVPGFHLAGREIWGATAMVLAEFLAVLGWTGRKAT